MLPHIGDYMGKTIAGDTGISEKFLIAHNNQSPFSTGKSNVQPRLLPQKPNAPLVAASDGGIDDDITLATLECIHCVDIDFDVAQWGLLEAVPDQLQLRPVWRNDADGICLPLGGDFLVQPL